MNGELPDLFTQPRRIGILRTSPYGHPRKFGCTILFGRFSYVRIEALRGPAYIRHDNTCLYTPQRVGNRSRQSNLQSERSPEYARWRLRAPTSLLSAKLTPPVLPGGSNRYLGPQ